ncbi:MAG: efflux RND transporter periplasmic adaptor subunit, partial [Pseudomonadota bacterium]
MRLFSVIAALAVGAGIYFLVIDREAGRSLLGQVASEENTEVAAETMVADAVRSDRVRVLVKKFKAQAIDTAVVLRGQTRAAREVDVKSETSAIVISEPLRKGQFVEAGQELCRLEIGARGAALEQARAQLDEARARAPEAEAVLEQSQALLKEAEINQNASSRLNDSGFASTTRVANAEANVATALAAVESARAGLRAAQSGIEAAESTVASAEREIEQLSIKAPFSG